jgi:Prohead core protein serine protease
MKLIAEFTDHKIEVLTERTEKGAKNHFITGVFMQSEARNRNGRIYPKAVMEKAVDKYITEQVSTGRAVGELNHPEGPSINLDKVSHIIESLAWQGNDVVGKARILETPMGQIVKGLLDGGVRLGVSTRGMGSLEEKQGVMYVKDDFILSTVDIVQDPSAPTAFVNGIMEGVEWVWNNGLIQPQVIEKMETEIKKAPRSDLYETQVREFKNFLSLLKQKV